MPSITLVPTHAVLDMSRGESLTRKGDQTHLVFKVRPPSAILEPVRLSSGEKFSELDGTAVLHPGDPPGDKVKHQHTPLSSEKDVDVIGLLSYIEKYEDDLHPFPASYVVEIWVPHSHFAEMVGAARDGKMPSSILVDAVGEGFKYGWEPDGSGKDWDNKAHPRLLVVSATFALPLAGRDPDEEQEPSAPVTADLPATRAQAAELLRKVSQLPGKLFWIGAGMVLALVIFGR